MRRPNKLLRIGTKHKELRAWAGAHFDPELFSLQAVNSAFTLLAT